MKILVTGNMGYVGPVAVRQLRESYPDATIVGIGHRILCPLSGNGNYPSRVPGRCAVFYRCATNTEGNARRC